MDEVQGRGAEGAAEFTAAPAAEGGDWTDRVVEKTPWWAISMSVHLGLLVVAALVVMGAAAPEKEEVAVVRLAPRPVEPPPQFDPPRQPVERKDFVQSEDPVEEVQKFIPNAELSDHHETDDMKDFREVSGEMDNHALSRITGPGVVDVTGVGGGGGGGGLKGRGGRRRLMARGTRGLKSESAVLAGLRWLARHQKGDGSWDADGFPGECGRLFPGSCPGAGYPEFDTGMTGLSLLAFLGAGYTHLSRETYDGICFGQVVKKSLQWLQANQDAEGCVGGRSGSKYLYNHAIAALALCEAYGLSGSGLFKDNAQKSIDFLVAAQNPYKGWRYTARSGDNDTSVTGWGVMALKSAEISGLSVPRGAYEGAKAWLDEVTTADGDVGYNSKESTGPVVVQGKNEHYADHDALVAIAIMSRIFIDKNPNDPRLKTGADRLVRDLPVWDGPKIDYYYWYYASLALFQLDGPSGRFWDAWDDAMVKALCDHQKRKADGCQDGSWEAIDRWGFEGGRVYATAINVLTLEVYYRYENVFAVGKKGNREPK